MIIKEKTWGVLLFVTVVLTSMCFTSCGDDDDDKKAEFGNNFVVKGNVEKGPFISGSTITMQPMNNKMQATGSTYTSTITDDFGSFVFNPEQFTEPYARLSVSGYFYNEYQGNLSKGQITLQSVVDLTDKSSVNVNLLTHLKYQRILNLVNEGKMFPEANSQAQTELLKCFGLQSLNKMDASQFSIAAGSDESAALIVTSALLLGKRTEAEFTEYLAKLCADFADDGQFTKTVKEQMVSEYKDLYKNLDKITENLKNRYQSLGRTIDVKPLANFVDWDANGTIGDEAHDPNKPVTLSQNNIQVPVEGGHYKITFQSDVQLFTNPPYGNGIPTMYPKSLTVPAEIYLISQLSDSQTLEVDVKPNSTRFQCSEYVQLYDCFGNSVVGVSFSQAPNPEGTFLSSEGYRVFQNIGVYLISPDHRASPSIFTEITNEWLPQFNRYAPPLNLDHALRVYRAWSYYRSNADVETLEAACQELKNAIAVLDDRAVGNCETEEDLALPSKDVVRFILAAIDIKLGNKSEAQTLFSTIINSGRYSNSVPVLGYKDAQVFPYNYVLYLYNNLN